jgi:hypothetical protein
MVLTLEATLLLAEIASKTINAAAIALSKDEESWKDIRLGDLFIDEDYAAVKERVRKAREAKDNTP